MMPATKTTPAITATSHGAQERRSGRLESDMSVRSVGGAPTAAGYRRETTVDAPPRGWVSVKPVGQQGQPGRITQGGRLLQGAADRVLRQHPRVGVTATRDAD